MDKAQWRLSSCKVLKILLTYSPTCSFAFQHICDHDIYIICQNWYESVKLNRAYHDANFERYHSWSLREKAKLKVFCQTLIITEIHTQVLMQVKKESTEKQSTFSGKDQKNDHASRTSRTTTATTKATTFNISTLVHVKSMPHKNL